MGLLVNGQWQDAWYDTGSSKGKYIREDAQFRNWITADGSAGPTGGDGFKAEAGRYHLYVSLACPWAHRTLIMRVLKGLEEIIDVSVVSPIMLEHGWTYDIAQDSTGDGLSGHRYHHEIYTSVEPNYSGRVTVPVLWDKQRNTIVNNESSEIIRMLNSAFNHLTGNDQDYYPEEDRAAIDRWNDRIYGAINNGVYHGHFKCNRQKLEDFDYLPRYVRDVYQLPGIAETVDFRHIKTHYYASHKTINPTGIVPVGPEIDYS